MVANMAFDKQIMSASDNYHAGPAKGSGRKPRTTGRMTVARGPLYLGDQHRDLVDVAPGPVLAALERPDDRMAGSVSVGGRVPAGRVVATADVAAFQTDAHVQPRRAHGETLRAPVHLLGQLRDTDVVEMVHGLGMRSPLRARSSWSIVMRRLARGSSRRARVWR
jgi:hypothetical protein